MPHTLSDSDLIPGLWRRTFSIMAWDGSGLQALRGLSPVCLPDTSPAQAHPHLLPVFLWNLPVPCPGCRRISQVSQLSSYLSPSHQHTHLHTCARTHTEHPHTHSAFEIVSGVCSYCWGGNRQEIKGSPCLLLPHPRPFLCWDLVDKECRIKQTNSNGNMEWMLDAKGLGRIQTRTKVYF